MFDSFVDGVTFSFLLFEGSAPSSLPMFFRRKMSVSTVLDCSNALRISTPYISSSIDQQHKNIYMILICTLIQSQIYLFITSLYPTRTVFSSSEERSVTPKPLRAAMPEMADVGATVRSSMTLYVTAPCTNPMAAAGA